MSPEKFALTVGLAVFAGGAMGLILQRILPENSTTGGPRDMIGAIVGLLTLLAALTMGLLIWTAYGVYAAQNVSIQTLAAKVLQLEILISTTTGRKRSPSAQNCGKAYGRRSTSTGSSSGTRPRAPSSPRSSPW